MLDRITMQRSMRVMDARGAGRREVLGSTGSPVHATPACGRALGAALALVASLGCGNATDGTTLTRPASEAPGLSESEPGASGGAPSNTGEPAGPDGASGMPPDGPGALPPGGLPPEGLPGSNTGSIQTEAELVAVLQRECGSCHAGDSDGGAALRSLQGLIDIGLILPGSGETSPLVLRFLYGDARREHAVLLNPASSELADIIQFINTLPQPTCGPLPAASRDQLVAAMRRDLEARPAESRPFLRYVAIQPTEPSACGSLERQIGAFLELSNAVSLGPSVVIPDRVAVDAATATGPDARPPLYALDLRDYAWDRAIDRDEDGRAEFADGWAAIVESAGVYALELSGPDADVVKRETGVAVPFLPSHAFIAAAAALDTYFALVGVRSNVFDTALDLGALDAAPHRAGVFGSQRLADRVVTRREQGSGRAWWTREELGEGDSLTRQRLVDEPIGYPVGSTEVMFSLPNGLWAFAVATREGSLVGQLPNCVVECPLPLRATLSVTCRGCHSGGLLGVGDDMLTYALAYPQSYDADTLTSIQAEYRPDLHQSLERDQLRYYAALFSAVGEGPAPDRIGRVYNEFWSRPIDATTAAAELGISVEALRAGIERGPAPLLELAPLLEGGSVWPERFRAHLRALACSAGGAENLPASCP